MRFRVLGPVDVHDDGERLALGGAKPRLLLAVLLTEPGRVVPADRLVDILWAEAPPRTARSLIHTYASVLRRALNRPDREVIVTRAPGYLVRAEGSELDSVDFQRLVATARASVAAGRVSEAIEIFRAADGLWRGPAYACGTQTALRTEAARLEELRLSAIEERIAAQMELGLEKDVVGELTSLVATHPAHERLRAQLMVALYRLGRQAEALAVYHEGRKDLAEQLGIDPGPELRRVHGAILRSDPALLAPGHEAAAAGQPSRSTQAAPALHQHRLREALHLLGQAYADVISTSLDAAIGYTGRLISTTRLEHADVAQARADLVEAVAAYRRLCSRRGEEPSVRGLVGRAMGGLDGALARGLEALVTFRSLGDDGVKGPPAPRHAPG